MTVLQSPGPAPVRYRVFLAGYALVLWALMPLVWRYFRRRARGDAAYGLHLEERRGEGAGFAADLWVHAVSLGEMTSAEPLVRRALDEGHRVLTTHATPAGRRRSETRFSKAIASGQMAVRYAPVDRARYWRRFLATHRPKVALVMEMEFWPAMIEAAAQGGVPLVLANSQVPSKSFARARRLARVFGHPVAHAAAVFAKSEVMAERFRALGASDVRVMGETRFDMVAPPGQLAAGAALKVRAGRRPVLTIASVVAGEEPVYLAAVKSLLASDNPPLVIWVPRAPEKFAASAELLKGEGLAVLRRSMAFGVALEPVSDMEGVDVLLGDTMGEMNFYMAPADAVIVGGGFRDSGAHNVIEPLALGKPVVTGPEVWTIEFPAVEAEAAGVLTICPDADGLTQAVTRAMEQGNSPAEGFHATYAGASARIYDAIRPLLQADG